MGCNSSLKFRHCYSAHDVQLKGVKFVSGLSVSYAFPYTTAATTIVRSHVNIFYKYESLGSKKQTNTTNTEQSILSSLWAL